MRYTKKPVVVDAFEWKPEDLYAAGSVLGLLGHSGANPSVAEGKVLVFWCEKSNANVSVAPGGYVISELDGKGFYPCTALDFSVLYSPVL